MKAMKCRAQQNFKKIDIKVGFNHAEGPVFTNLIQEVQNGVQNTQNQWKTYGSQRTAPNNDTVISQAPEAIQQTLQGYNNYAVVDIDKTIV